jgi:DNA replication protein DnaC
MGELKRMSTGSRLKLPQGVFERLGGKSTAEEATRSCPLCGTDLPPVHSANGFLPGKCVCEQKRYDEARAEKVRAEQRERERAKLHASCERCYSWLGEELTPLKSKTFENYRREQFPEVYEKLHDFASQRDEQGKAMITQRNFVIFGGFGTGKTHLMSAVINNFCEQLIPCRFMTGQGFFDAISHCFSNRYDHTHYLNEAANAPVLAIDDIDKVYIPERLRESEDNFQVKTFFAIMNKRYLKQLPTLITTNSLDITKYVGGAAFSRLKEGGELLQMEGDDFRDSMMRM